MNEENEVLKENSNWDKRFYELRPHFNKITKKYLRSILEDFNNKKISDFDQILRENEGDFYDQIVQIFGGERLEKNVLQKSLESVLKEAYRLNMLEEFIKVGGVDYFWYYCLGEVCISIQN